MSQDSSNLDTVSLHTKNIQLRVFNNGDLFELRDIHRDPQHVLSRGMKWKSHVNLIETGKLLERFKRINDSYVVFAIHHLVIDTMIRWVYFNYENSHISYVLHKDFHGCGIMTVSLELFITWLFEECDVPRITAFVCDWNSPSQRLLKTLGFSEVTANNTSQKFINGYGEVYDQLEYVLMRS